MTERTDRVRGGGGQQNLPLSISLVFSALLEVTVTTVCSQPRAGAVLTQELIRHA